MGMNIRNAGILLCVVIASGLAATTNLPGSQSPASSQGDAHPQRAVETPPLFPPAPAGPVITAPPLSPEKLTISGFTSVQVNVDANGNDVLNDAANEPTIAIDPNDPNIIVIGWRQFDNIASDFRQTGVGHSHDRGQTWAYHGPLWPGHFGSDPVIDVDAEGNFYYLAIGFDSPGVRLFRSFDGGVNWDGPTAVRSSFFDKEWLVIDRTNGPGRGLMYSDWTDVRQFTRSVDGGETWMPSIQIPLSDTVWGTLSVDPDGRLFACDQQFNVARSSNAQYADQTPVFELSVNVNLGGSLSGWTGPNPGGLLGQPWVATDHTNGPTRGNIYLLCSVDPRGTDPLDVRFARSTDGGVSWSDSVRVNDDPTDNNAWQWFGTMSVAPSGRIDAVWYDTRNTGVANRSEVFYAYSTDAGQTWSRNIQVAPAFDSYIGWPQQNKIGDYIGSISDLGGMNVAYAATYTGGQDVYFLRIAPDCNGNGIHDGDDIAAGYSTDNDGDGIPDECQIDCSAIARFRAVCRNGKVRAKVRSTLPDGTKLTIDNNGDSQIMTIGADGRGKVVWTHQTGAHTVFVVVCPQFSQDVGC